MPEPGDDVRAKRWRVLVAAALALVLTIPASITAYYRAFVGFRPYDDEGTLMDLTRSFLSGHPLYNVVPCIYGPAFFLYQWAAHRLWNVEVTTDSIRFLSVAFWIAADVLVFWLVYRGSRSWVLASAAFVMVFPLLGFLGEDPGHPQELCLLLVLAMGVAASYAANARHAMWWLGVAAGALAMTKINIGALMVMAIALVVSYTVPWRIARAAAIAGSLGFVWLLLAPLLSMDWTRRYLMVEELSLVAVMITLGHVPFDIRIGWREIVAAAAGFAATALALAAFALANGSTVGAMIQWLIVKPRASIGPAWFWELMIEDRMLVWTVAGVVGALAAHTRWVRPWMTATAKLVLGAGMVILVLHDRVPYLMTAVPPFLWLLTVTEDKEARERLSTFSRSLLAAAGVLMMLYAYPVAGGTQINLTAVVLIAITAIAIGDGAWWLAARLGRGRRPLLWLAYAAAASMLVWFCMILPMQARDSYDATPALAVPGARRLHLPDDAAGLRKLVQIARANCTTLLTAPGMPSFNIWTGLPRPAALSGGNWVAGVDDATQEKVVREIAGDPKLCVIYNREMVAMWTHDSDVSAKPVIRFIHENFRAVAQGRGNALMVRR
jgi:hypothetical protein